MIGLFITIAFCIICLLCWLIIFLRKKDTFNGQMSFLCSLFVLVMMVICHFLELRDAHYEIVKFEATRQTIISQRTSGNGLENVELTKTIIQKNEWLAEYQEKCKSIYCGFFWSKEVIGVKPIK